MIESIGAAYPATSNIEIDNIPDSMKTLSQWVLWQMVPRENRWTKVPYQPNGATAKTNDPTTWCSFEQAVNTLGSSHKGFSGIRFVFSTEDPFWGIDIDKCITGGELTPNAHQYLNTMDSYTEISPSETGLHIIIEGPTGKHKGHRKSQPADGIKEIEIYSSGRFFTFTGNTLAKYPATPQKRDDQLGMLLNTLGVKIPTKEQATLDVSVAPQQAIPTANTSNIVSDEELIEKIRNSKQGLKFSSLYDSGSLAEYDGDPSRADMALCSILAFYTTDNTLIDSIFRKSRLYRPKWDTARGDGTYGTYTIRKAIESSQKTTNPKSKFSAPGIRMVIDSIDEPNLLAAIITDTLARAECPAVEEEQLIKFAASKANISERSLKSDIAKQRKEYLSPTDIGSAHKALETFGEGNIIYINGNFWQWKNTGVWRTISQQGFKKRIHSILPPRAITKNKVNSILDLAASECHDDDITLSSSFDGVNCLNGELIWQNGQWDLRPHERGNYLINQIPVTYSPEAKAPRFLQFLDEIFVTDPDKQDKKQLMLELIGYTLQSSTEYPAFVILIGAGSNGKSVLLDLIIDLCGKENTTAIPPNKMENLFLLIQLHGKLANIITEIPEGHILEDAKLKAISSGDLMTADQKYKDQLSFQPYSTNWFGTNHLPQTKDYTDALFRRAYIVTFNQKFEGKNDDPQLKQKLKKELSGVMNLALNAFAKVKKSGQFTQPASMLDQKAKWRLEADQVKLFLTECCIRGDHKTAKQTVYREYCDWTQRSGITAKLTRQQLTQRLVRLGISEGRSSTERHYIGIAISSPY